MCFDLVRRTGANVASAAVASLLAVAAPGRLRIQAIAFTLTAVSLWTVSRPDLIAVTRR
jgi:hypothetical protein